MPKLCDTGYPMQPVFHYVIQRQDYVIQRTLYLGHDTRCLHKIAEISAPLWYCTTTRYSENSSIIQRTLYFIFTAQYNAKTRWYTVPCILLRNTTPKLCDTAYPVFFYVIQRTLYLGHDKHCLNKIAEISALCYCVCSDHLGFCASRNLITVLKSRHPNSILVYTTQDCVLTMLKKGVSNTIGLITAPNMPSLYLTLSRRWACSGYAEPPFTLLLRVFWPFRIFAPQPFITEFKMVKSLHPRVILVYCASLRLHKSFFSFWSPALWCCL